MPVLSRVEGLIDVNQTKRIRKPSILNRKESRNYEIAS